MPAPVTLPFRTWGSADASRRALLIHGLTSNAAQMWSIGAALADAGWRADAVDQRGHGTAPRTLDYTIAAYAADVAATRPHTTDPHADPSAPWDLVVGHSLGGTVSTVAAADDPSWTRRLVLIDPGIYLVEEEREIVRQNQRESFAHPSYDDVRRANPHWHDLDVELRVLAVQQVSRWAVDQTSDQNVEWDVREWAARLTVPTHIIGGDPEVYSIFAGKTAADVLRNPHVTMSVVTGTGHSPQRDNPAETIAQLMAALA